MKHFILTFTIFLISISLLAQSVIFTNPTIIKEGPLQSTTISYSTNIINNTSSSVNLTWVRFENNLPANWFSQICDDNLCYDSTVSTSVYGATLAPGDTTFMLGYIGMDGVTEGNGDVKVVVYDASDSVNTAAVFNFKYNAWPLSVTEPVKLDVKIFPNPAKSVVNIENLNNSIDRVELYDITGKKIASQKRTTESITLNVSNYSHGTYFIRIIGLKNETLQVKMIQKIK